MSVSVTLSHQIHRAAFWSAAIFLGTTVLSLTLVVKSYSYLQRKPA